MQVVAALIEHEGKVLVCQRRRGSAFELLWEFPGGKRRPDETLEAALARELAEESASRRKSAAKSTSRSTATPKCPSRSS